MVRVVYHLSTNALTFKANRDRPIMYGADRVTRASKPCFKCSCRFLGTAILASDASDTPFLDIAKVLGIEDISLDGDPWDGVRLRLLGSVGERAKNSC